MQVLQKVVPQMRAAHASVGDDTLNFFTMLRFDFLLDENHDLYVTEVRPTFCTIAVAR